MKGRISAKYNIVKDTFHHKFDCQANADVWFTPDPNGSHEVTVGGKQYMAVTNVETKKNPH